MYGNNYYSENQRHQEIKEIEQECFRLLSNSACILQDIPPGADMEAIVFYQKSKVDHFYANARSRMKGLQPTLCFYLEALQTANVKILAHLYERKQATLSQPRPPPQPLHTQLPPRAQSVDSAKPPSSSSSMTDLLKAVEHASDPQMLLNHGQRQQDVPSTSSTTIPSESKEAVRAGPPRENNHPIPHRQNWQQQPPVQQQQRTHPPPPIPTQLNRSGSTYGNDPPVTRQESNRGSLSYLLINHAARPAKRSFPATTTLHRPGEVGFTFRSAGLAQFQQHQGKRLHPPSQTRQPSQTPVTLTSSHPAYSPYGVGHGKRTGVPSKKPRPDDEQARPYVCDFPGCGKRFTRPSYLKQHMNSHSGKLRYVCPLKHCGKAFAWPCNLSSHMRMHRRFGDLDDSGGSDDATSKNSNSTSSTNLVSSQGGSGSGSDTSSRAHYALTTTSMTVDVDEAVGAEALSEMAITPQLADTIPRSLASVCAPVTSTSPMSPNPTTLQDLPMTSPPMTSPIDHPMTLTDEFEDDQRATTVQA